MIFIPILAITVILGIIINFYSFEVVNYQKLERFTRKGNLYFHDLTNKEVENAHYTWLYVCEDELREEWKKVSHLNYDSAHTSNGQEVNKTLIRYLTSLGLRKDADGFSNLTPTDIRNIESGKANYLFHYPRRMDVFIYKLIWQIDSYFKGANPGGQSFTQRIEYWKAGFSIIKKHFWFGTGTGDVDDVFIHQFEEMHSQLDSQYRHRAHNQFLTFLISFGIFGFLLSCFSLFYPLYYNHIYKDFFLSLFIIILVISMLNEDTLETQAGATFFAYFYSLFAFGKEKLI